MTGAAESACGCADGTCGAGPTTTPARSRGVIALLEENCTVCMLCAQECPDWCIEISSHTEVEPAEGRGGRPRTRNVLDDFSIDFGLCMYCGICVEVCPFDALFWAPTSDYAATEAAGLVHGREQLRSWLRDVPAPPPLDAAAAAPGEVVAAERAGVVAGERPGSAEPGAGAAGAGGPGPGRTAP